MLAAGGCDVHKLETQPPTSIAASRNQVRLRGVVFERFEADRLRIRTWLDSANVDRKTGATQGEDVEVLVHPRAEGGPIKSLVITAPRGTSQLRTQSARLEGGVKMVDDVRRTLVTGALSHDDGQDRLTSDGTATITGDNFEIVGSRLEAQPSKGMFHLDGPVRMRVEPR
jgi:hypothetical protein